MPKGLDKIAAIAEVNAAKQAAYAEGGDFLRALVLKPKDVAMGRFLEEGSGITFVYVHELPKKQGQKYGDKILCLDQDDAGVQCYACERDGVGRSTRVIINFIRYNEPKLQRDADKKPVKDAANNYVYETVANPAVPGGLQIVTEPMLTVWNAPTSVSGRLAYLESQNGGMSNHVVTIARTTDDKNPWMIDIAEKGKKPEAFEVEMFNKKPADLEKAVTQLGIRSIPAMTYGDMVRAYGGSTAASGFAPDAIGAPVTTENNIYAQAAAKDQPGGAGTLNLGAFGS